MNTPNVLRRWLIIAVFIEALLWWSLLGIETDPMKPYIGQTGVLLIGSMLLLFAVLVVPTVIAWLAVLFLRNRRMLRRMMSIDR